MAMHASIILPWCTRCRQKWEHCADQLQQQLLLFQRQGEQHYLVILKNTWCEVNAVASNISPQKTYLSYCRWEHGVYNRVGQEMAAEQGMEQTSEGQTPMDYSNWSSLHSHLLDTSIFSEVRQSIFNYYIYNYRQIISLIERGWQKIASHTGILWKILRNNELLCGLIFVNNNSEFAIVSLICIYVQ